jgi:tRNA(Arg) A34 adenosine deaminase TadA
MGSHVNVAARHVFYIQAAIECAKHSVLTHKHGCVVVHRNKIVSTGWNEHSLHIKQTFSLHAEISAVAKLKKKPRNFLSNCTMYVVRLSSRGNIHLSKPCIMCTNVLERSGIGRIIYSDSDGFDPAHP